MMRVTPPTVTNASSATSVDRPTASSVEKPSGARSPTRSPLPTSTRIRSSTAVVPSNPSSSPIAAKMKSVAANGISPDDPAARHPELRLRELSVALREHLRRIERVQPDVDAQLDVVEQQPPRVRAH